jgi:hypothetical protein
MSEGYDDAIIDTLGAQTFARLQDARLFMVGCGGIGCELLKNLVLSGARNIHIVSVTFLLPELFRYPSSEPLHVFMPTLW